MSFFSFSLAARAVKRPRGMRSGTAAAPPRKEYRSHQAKKRNCARTTLRGPARPIEEPLAFICHFLRLLDANSGEYRTRTGARPGVVRQRYRPSAGHSSEEPEQHHAQR